MNTHQDIITAIANYDTQLSDPHYGNSYAITGSAVVEYGVTLHEIVIESDVYTTTTAALSYDYCGDVLAIENLAPAYVTPQNLDQYTWIHTTSGKRAIMYNDLPRIF